MKNPLGGGNGMVPHYSGTTLDAQARYAAGAREILENYLSDKPQNPANIIVGKGEFADVSVRESVTDVISVRACACASPAGYETKACEYRQWDVRIADTVMLTLCSQMARGNKHRWTSTQWKLVLVLDVYFILLEANATLLLVRSRVRGNKAQHCRRSPAGVSGRFC